MELEEILKKIKPYILGWMAAYGGGGGDWYPKTGGRISGAVSVQPTEDLPDTFQVLKANDWPVFLVDTNGSVIRVHAQFSIFPTSPSGGSTYFSLHGFGVGASGRTVMDGAGGTEAAATPLLAGNNLGMHIFGGCIEGGAPEEASYINGAYIVAVALEDFSSNYEGIHHGTRLDFYVTPLGPDAGDPVLAASLYPNYFDLPEGSTYNINGEPHSHAPEDLGLEIGVDVQAHSDALDTLAGLAGSPAFISGEKFSKSFIITNPTAPFDLPLWRVPANFTVTAVHLLCKGNVVVGQLWEYDGDGLNGSTVDSSDITGVVDTNVDDDGTLSNPGIASGNYLGWKTTSVTGTPTYAIITFEGYYN